MVEVIDSRDSAIQVNTTNFFFGISLKTGWLK